MHTLKIIAKVGRWLDAEHGFMGLSADARRRAWLAAGLTHVLLLPIAWTLVTASAVLSLAVHNIVISHLLIAVLLAKVVEGASAFGELLRRAPLRLVTSGWFFAFAVTLQPLLVLAFALWLLR